MCRKSPTCPICLVAHPFSIATSAVGKSPRSSTLRECSRTPMRSNRMCPHGTRPAALGPTRVCSQGLASHSQASAQRSMPFCADLPRPPRAMQRPPILAWRLRPPIAACCPPVYRIGAIWVATTAQRARCARSSLSSTATVPPCQTPTTASAACSPSTLLDRARGRFAEPTWKRLFPLTAIAPVTTCSSRSPTATGSWRGTSGPPTRTLQRLLTGKSAHGKSAK